MPFLLSQPNPGIDTPQPSPPPVPGVKIPPVPDEDPPGDLHPIGEPGPSDPDDPAKKPAIM